MRITLRRFTVKELEQAVADAEKRGYILIHKGEGKDNNDRKAYFAVLKKDEG